MLCRSPQQNGAIKAEQGNGRRAANSTGMGNLLSVSALGNTRKTQRKNQAANAVE